MTDIKSFFLPHQHQQHNNQSHNNHNNHNHNNNILSQENQDDHHIYPPSIPRLFNPSSNHSNNNNGGIFPMESSGINSILSLPPSFINSDNQKNINTLANNSNSNSKKDNFLPSNIGNGYLVSAQPNFHVEPNHHPQSGHSSSNQNNFPFPNGAFFSSNSNNTFHPNGPKTASHNALLRSSDSSIVNNLNNIYITGNNNNNPISPTSNNVPNNPQMTSYGSGSQFENASFNHDTYLTVIPLSCIKCNCSSNVDVSNLLEVGIAVIPGPDDKSYEFKCIDCHNGITFFFKHSPKTWKEMIHTSLYNLEREKKYRFSHYREVRTYIQRNPQFLLSDREKETGKMKNVITATLSYNRKLFVSFARDSGMWSNWRPGDKLREDDRGLLILEENTFEKDLKVKEKFYYKLECKDCSKSVSFEISELCGSCVVPGPQDSRFEFACEKCSVSKRPTLIHQSKSWKEVAHTALFNLEREKKYRFSHQIEIATFVKDHPESFSFNREIENIKNRLSTVLSRYKKSFTSIGRYTGLWSNWRDGDENLKELECDEDDSDEEPSSLAGTPRPTPEKKGAPKTANSPSANGKKRTALPLSNDFNQSDFSIQKSQSSTPLAKSRQPTPTFSSSSSPNNFIMSPISDSPYFNNNNGNNTNGNQNSSNSPKLSPDSSSTTPILNNSPNFFYPSPNFHPTNISGSNIPTSIGSTSAANSSHNLMHPSNLFNSSNSLVNSPSYKKTEIVECGYCKKTKNTLFKCSLPYCPKSFCQDCLIEYHPHLQPKPNHLNEWCCPSCISSNNLNTSNPSLQFPSYSNQANNHAQNNLVLLQNPNSQASLSHSHSFPSANSFMIASNLPNSKHQFSNSPHSNGSKSSTPKRSSSVNDMRVNTNTHDSPQKPLLFPLDQTLYSSPTPKDKRFKPSLAEHQLSHSLNNLNNLSAIGSNGIPIGNTSPSGVMGFSNNNHPFHAFEFNNNSQSNFYNSSIPSIQFPTLNHSTFSPPLSHSQSLPAISTNSSFTHVLNPFHHHNNNNSPLSKSFSPETKITEHHNNGSIYFNGNNKVYDQ